ncbi:MAG: hypothetical protein U1F83_07360 [Verrucomicrobiota bacterium]
MDYSHGIRLVQQQMIVSQQETTTVARVLADPKLTGLLSDEGAIASHRYSTDAIPTSTTNTIEIKRGYFGECIASFKFDPEVRIQINGPMVFASKTRAHVADPLRPAQRQHHQRGKTVGKKPARRRLALRHPAYRGTNAVSACHHQPESHCRRLSRNRNEKAGPPGAKTW